ncbi:MAG: prolyl oligopeptidase family serine peptidase [Oligoflexales bacterium]
MDTPKWMQTCSLSYPMFTSKGLFYQKKYGEDGHWIVLRDIDSGCVEPILKGVKTTLGYGGRGWSVSSCGNHLVFCDRNKVLWKHHVSSAKQEKICEGFEGLGAPWVSNDGKKIVFSAEKNGLCQVWMWSEQGGDLRCLSARSWFAWNASCHDEKTVWCEWNEGVMPWEESHLVFETENGLQCLKAEGASLSYPGFSKDGSSIIYTSDELGSRQLWRYSLETQQTQQLSFVEGEVYRPDWICGSSPWAQTSDSEVGFIYSQNGIEKFGCLKNFLNNPFFEDQNILEHFTVVDGVSGADGKVFLSGQKWDHPGKIIEKHTAKGVETTDWKVCDTARVGGDGVFPREELCIESLSWTLPGAKTQVFGVLRKSKSKTKAPLWIHIHGGPTSCETQSWRPDASFWNLKGWHWLSVNHRGSSGYGRFYQDTLREQWGCVDVEDVCSAARYAVQEGIADPDQIYLFGGSAGGWTVLQAMIAEPDLWAGGVALYPVSDLSQLEEQTHRFEKSYNHFLVGDRAVWDDRSPIFNAHRILKPLLLCHGLDDQAIPFTHSENLASRIDSEKVRFLPFEQEGHGFSLKAKQKVWEEMEAFFAP